jgi:hypothetical protein
MSLLTCRVSNFLIWECVAPCDEFCIFEKLYVETFRILPWFMHCQQRGEVCAWFGNLGTFGRCSNSYGSFWKVWCRSGLMGRSNRPQAVRWPIGGLTARCRRSNRARQSEQCFSLCCIPMLHCCIGLGGVCFGSWGACMCRRSYLCCSSIGLVVWALLLEHGFVSDVSSCCPCLRSTRLVFYKWSCSLPFFCFRSLVEVLLIRFFFLFSLVTNHVGCQFTHQGGDW